MASGEALDPQQRESGYRRLNDDLAAGAVAIAGFRRLNDDLTASGAEIASAALADPAEGTGVTVADGRIFTTDGPYAEAKEFLSGFYLIDCDGIDQAVEHAAKLPEAEFGLVEVRPVLGPERDRVVSDDLGRSSGFPLLRPRS